MRLDNKKVEKVIIPSNKKEEDKNPFAKVEQAQQKAIEEKLDEVLKPLNALTKSEKSRVPVEYFRSTFASKFQDMIDNKKPDEKVVRSWLKIAGGGHREVDLIDNEGTVIDTVPKILNDIPPLSEIENRNVKTMAQTIVLDGENQNGSVNFFAEAEARHHLSGMGKVLSAAVLAYQPNIDNAIAFKKIVTKYSNKLTEEEIDEKINNKEEAIQYIID